MPKWIGTKKHCDCGKRISRYSEKCKTCHHKNNLENAKTFEEFFKNRTCPRCGDGLIENISMCDTYWLQCQNFGMNKKDEKKKPCNFQILALRDAVHEVRWQDKSPLILKDDIFTGHAI